MPAHFGGFDFPGLKQRCTIEKWHIIKALAELPIFKISPAVVTKDIVILKPNERRILE